MTPPQRRALFVLWEHGPLTGENFAKQMWPFSPSWTYQTASMRNHALEGAAGTFLGRLRKMGLVADAGKIPWGIAGWWELTTLGRRVLRREQILEKIV